VRPLGHGIERLIDRNWPGPRISAVVRTRLIDDLVTEALDDGAEQVLLLGAGYDSRAHRMPAMPATYEFDHPLTQQAKRALVADPPHVEYVPVDLNADDLGAALDRAGFPRRRTMVVWEGVTNYLTADAVDATLRGLAAATAPGSTVVFTYVDRAALDSGSPGFTAWRGDAAARYHRAGQAAPFYRVARAVTR
jgi:methyltransferase (TIGR00027 family)